MLLILPTSLHKIYLERSKIDGAISLHLVLFRGNMTVDVEKGAAASSSDDEEGGVGDGQQVLVLLVNLVL